jgi:hypothetical protein
MAHQLLYPLGRTEEDGFGAMLLTGIHRVGHCPQRSSGFSLRRSNRSKLAAHNLWRLKKERKENEDESIWKDLVDWRLRPGAGRPFFGLCGCERAGRW